MHCVFWATYLTTSSGQRSDKIFEAGALRKAAQRGAGEIQGGGGTDARDSGIRQRYAKMVEAGALQPLVAMMTMGSEEAKMKTAFTLAHLGRWEKTRTKIVDAGALQPLAMLRRE